MHNGVIFKEGVCMEHSQFLRSEMLLGSESTNRLCESRVILFGLGGVGSYTAEALARAGVGNITVVDSDCVAPASSVPCTRHSG